MEISRKSSSALFGLVAFCFFLPFLTFSCGGSEMHLSGVEAAFGATIERPTLFGQKPKVEKVDGDVSAILALSCAVVGILLGLTRLKQGYLASITTGGLGAICLFVLKSKVEREALQEGGGMVQVSFDFGFWLALLGFAAAVALNAYLLSEGRKKVAKASRRSDEFEVSAVGPHG